LCTRTTRFSPRIQYTADPQHDGDTTASSADMHAVPTGDNLC